jgi:hypothetical protein
MIVVLAPGCAWGYQVEGYAKPGTAATLCL